MKQLLILSGKGGTGKTTIASAFIQLSGVKAYADCDVDAPNLHLVLKQTAQVQRTDYYGMKTARINPELCIKCGRCAENCRFQAVKEEDPFAVDPYACEGCGLCQVLCPAGAVSLVPNIAGELMLDTGNGKVFSTAQLKMGSGTSGKLVREVKKQMKAAASSADVAVIDGSPGIGCPVIASLNGVNLVLIVAEPSVSGISDKERIIRTAKLLHIRLAVCINKADVNIDKSEEIESFCREHEIPFVGRIPYDASAVSAINSGLTITDIDCPAGRAARCVYEKTFQLLNS
ncbi:MAG: 4Fe-4S binding protein [Clostridiales bacterium]|nr:4Fe-4S binding protein [Clostridiales bacterium]